MGGVVASQLALNAPERIRSLSLLCTFHKGKKNAAKINAWKVYRPEVPSWNAQDEKVCFSRNDLFEAGA